jgi:hypothetical protein
MKTVFKHHKWQIAFGLLAVLVLAWAFLRPDRVARLDEVSPELVAQLRAYLPAGQPPSVNARLRAQEMDDGVAFVRVQQVEMPASGILRRNGKKYSPSNLNAPLEESSSLAIGPILLVRHNRMPPPIAGDLLPNHFWHTRVLKKAEVRRGRVFPTKPGEVFEVDIWTEIRNAEGNVTEVETGRMTCTAAEQVAAATLHVSISGNATKVVCEDSGPASSHLKTMLKQTIGQDAVGSALHVVTHEHWFVEKLGFTILLKSTERLRVGAEDQSDEITILRKLEKIDLK